MLKDKENCMWMNWICTRIFICLFLLDIFIRTVKLMIIVVGVAVFMCLCMRLNETLNIRNDCKSVVRCYCQQNSG